MASDYVMKVGALLMPSHPPERPIDEGQRSDLEELSRLDRLGFDEAWIGEHFTARWEPCPAPDLLIAQALLQTDKIRLGPLGHLLPYHHPVGMTRFGPKATKGIMFCHFLPFLRKLSSWVFDARSG
jgi:hypothetical protein